MSDSRQCISLARSQSTIGSQYISYDLKLDGNGTYSCSWTPDLTPGSREILLVE